VKYFRRGKQKMGIEFWQGIFCNCPRGMPRWRCDIKLKLIF
jgi:hypothetical protein